MNPNIHALRRWLFEHEETLATFSARTGIATSYLSEIMTGKKRPSLGTIDKITAATAREVTANDFQNVREPT
jgi:transcriptional regulator with XRE-family HTH domain